MFLGGTSIFGAKLTGLYTVFINYRYGNKENSWVGEKVNWVLATHMMVFLDV